MTKAKIDLEALIPDAAKQPRKPKLKLPALACGDEMSRWRALATRSTLSGGDGKDGCALIAPIDAPLTELLKKTIYVERVQAFLCATTLIAGDDNQMQYAASWSAGSDGNSRVYYIHDDDWGMHPTHASIAAFLQDHFSRAKKVKQKLPKAPLPQDPVLLFSRSEWLIQFFMFAFHTYQISRWEQSLVNAPPLSEFRDELPLLGSSPHLALYWLWAHTLFDNAAELKATRDAIAKSPFAPVQESLALLKEATGKRKKSRLADKIAEFKEFVAPTAPATLRASAANKTAAKPSGADAILGQLRAAAKEDASLSEALRLLDDFDRGKHVESNPEWTWFKPQLRFAELVDARFEPLVIARIRNAARLGDRDRRATRGMIFAWAALAGSYARFCEIVDGAGTDKLELDRVSELYRAVGKFADQAAIARLSEAANEFIAKLRSDDGYRFHQAFETLIERDCPEARAAIVKLLDTFDPKRWEERAWKEHEAQVIAAALTAGKWGLAAAANGIERAIAGGAGTDSSNLAPRGKLYRALYLTAGGHARAFVQRQYEKHVAKDVSQENSDRQRYHRHELACIVGAQLLIQPDDATVRARVAEIWGRYLAQTELSTADYWGLAVLLRAIEAGKIEGFEMLLEHTRSNTIKMHYDYMKKLADSVRELAGTVLQSLRQPQG